MEFSQKSSVNYKGDTFKQRSLLSDKKTIKLTTALSKCLDQEKRVVGETAHCQDLGEACKIL